jgi:hypothetical protein
VSLASRLTALSNHSDAGRRAVCVAHALRPSFLCLSQESPAQLPGLKISSAPEARRFRIAVTTTGIRKPTGPSVINAALNAPVIRSRARYPPRYCSSVTCSSQSTALPSSAS